MSFNEAMELANDNERFMATVYAMNTLLIRKGVYSRQEFRDLFTEWVDKEERKKTRSKAASQPRARSLASEA